MAGDEGVFVEHTLNDHLSGDFGCGREGVEGLLDRTEMFVHGVEKKDGVYVVIVKLTHRGDTLIEGLKFGNCVANGMVVGEVNLKPFNE